MTNWGNIINLDNSRQLKYVEDWCRYTSQNDKIEPVKPIPQHIINFSWKMIKTFSCQKQEGEKKNIWNNVKCTVRAANFQDDYR